MLNTVVNNSKEATPIQATNYDFSDKIVNVNEVVANTNIMV